MTIRATTTDTPPSAPVNSAASATTTVSSNVVAASSVLRVEVIDSGAGISRENMKKLFGQYVQFNANALQKGGGSGLGLWICKGQYDFSMSERHLIKAFNGEMWILFDSSFVVALIFTVFIIIFHHFIESKKRRKKEIP